jgi:hypothetical protein
MAGGIRNLPAGGRCRVVRPKPETRKRGFPKTEKRDFGKPKNPISEIR